MEILPTNKINDLERKDTISKFRANMIEMKY